MSATRSDSWVVYRSDDSYCGPISMLARLASGDIVLVFREARWRGEVTHFDPTTHMSMLRSRDDGVTWFGQVTPDAAGGNGVTVTQLSDGTVLGTCFHWLFAPVDQAGCLDGRTRRREVPMFGLACALGGVHVVRSQTDGYTWSAPHPVPEPGGWAESFTFGAVVELPDGDLLMPCTASRSDHGRAHGLVLRSGDGGWSWGNPVGLTEEVPGEVNFHETRMVLCPSGTLLAMHRTPRGNYFRNRSTDGGRTWSATEDTGIWCGGSSPPDLRVLADGRLLLSRGYRRDPFGVRAYISQDDGASWPQEVVLRDDGPDRDVGYPSTVQLDDGSLLTVYYWHGDDGPRHLQATRWEIP
ncbi:MAG: sialidase family protein [Planctomycetota bacterium]